MKTVTAICTVGACLMSLSACAGLPGTELEDTTGMKSQGTDFQTALYNDYLKLSKSEYGEGDYVASDFFAERAQVSAEGMRTVQPVTPAYAQEEWNLAPGHADFMVAEREKLMSLFDAGMRDTHPTLAATAQSNFDCWVQETAENRQPEDIANCRDLYVTASNNMTQLVAANEQPEATLVVVATEEEAEPDMEPAAATPAPADVMVFFDWDSATVNPQSREILDKVADNVRMTKADIVRVVGHADTSGSATYNQELSMRRAQAVQDALKIDGLGMLDFNVEARGEQDTLVQTGDGVRNPQNRRVRIVVE